MTISTNALTKLFSLACTLLRPNQIASTQNYWLLCALFLSKACIHVSAFNIFRKEQINNTTPGLGPGPGIGSQGFSNISVLVLGNSRLRHWEFFPGLFRKGNHQEQYVWTPLL